MDTDKFRLIVLLSFEAAVAHTAVEMAADIGAAAILTCTLSGSTTLLVLWLPVCPHCKKFMPTVPALQKKYEKKGLKILTVTHGKKDYTARFLAGKKWYFGVGFDYTGRTARSYGMKGMPGVYLVGKDGRLRTYTGSLDAAIATCLAAK